MAPGMGLNNFFALVVSNIAVMTGMTYLESFRSALAIIFIEGMIFIILSLINVREKIYKAIPADVRILAFLSTRSAFTSPRAEAIRALS